LTNGRCRIGSSREERQAPGGAVAALLVAAGATIWIARVLPIHFTFRPNDLGIVSLTTVTAYPTQQETFWLLFAVVVGSLLAWAGARLLRAPARDLRCALLLEILGAGVLAATLFLNLAISAVVTVGLGIGMGVVVLRGGRIATERPLDDESPSKQVTRASDTELEPAAARVQPRRRRWAWAAPLLLVATLYSTHEIHTPGGFWGGVANLVWRTSDRDLVSDHWVFQAERGQHLVWADALARGELHGRDFFCLYGPLYDMGLVAAWKVLGRSVATVSFYEGLGYAIAMAGLLLLGRALLRRGWLVLLLPLALMPFVNVRVGIPLWGLWALVRWLDRGGNHRAALSGLICGISILFSQEFGVAFALAAAVVFVVRAEVRPALAFGGSILIVALPVVGIFIWEGALGAMLADLSQYPAWVAAGYANLPFPSLISSLPISSVAGGSAAELDLRLGFALPLVSTAALLLSVRIEEIDLRHPLATFSSLRRRLAEDPARLAVVAIAVFSLVTFRYAIGRTDTEHLVRVAAIPALLLLIGLDASLDLLRASSPIARARAGWCAAGLTFLAFQSGLLHVAQPVSNLERSVPQFARVFTGKPEPRAAWRALWLLDWLEREVKADDGLLLLPNNAGFYYLLGRTPPTRFGLASQMVTDAHRREALRDLERDPPEYVVVDEIIFRPDGIPDDLVLGSETMRWLGENYVLELQEHRFTILRYARSSSGAGELRGDMAYLGWIHDCETH
jgi:hypothetical protein